jgi:RHS repeat-associated protein
VLLGEVGSTFTDALGNVTTDSPDWRGMGLTNQDTNAMGGVTTVDRDVNGLATISVDQLNRITQYAYDSNGNVTEEIYPDLTTTTYGTYNSFAEPSSMTDQLGRITTYTYDSHGNLTVVEDPMQFVVTNTYSSTQPGMLTNQTAPATAGTSSYTLVTYQYDSKDRLTTITKLDSNVTKQSFSSAGQVTSVTDANNSETTYSYDAMNRETGTTIAAGTSIAGITTITYDKAGNQLTSTNADNETTTTTYDALDRTSTVENSDGSTTTYVYDNGGNLQALIDPVGNRTTYAYDSLNRQTTVTSPSVNSTSGEVSTTEYDADGEVISTTDADGRQITYSYDQLGRETGESWISGGSAIYLATFTYDADGEMKSATDSYATVTMSYDNDGRLGTMVTSGPGTGQPTVTLTYSYNSSGDVTSVTDSLSGSGAAGQGITSYVYDNALRLGTITQSLGGTVYAEVTISYDAAGLETNMDRSQGATGTLVTDATTYDAAEQAVTLTFANRSPNNTNLETIDYTYDKAGQATAETDKEGTASFTYDSDQQLTTVTGSRTESYGYDANGNRNTTGYNTGAGNELTNSPGVTYTYDNDGNMITATTSAGTTTYTYDYENRLTNVTQSGTVTATYTYNALGQRIGFDDSGTQTWTVYNGSSADANVYADFNSSGAMTTRYLYGPAVDQILARTSSTGTLAWYLTDNVGTVRDMTNSSGTVIDHIVYDSFGNITTQTNASEADRFLFAGMQYDSTAGIYYDHARYYDATIGRFMSQDPKGFDAGDTNLYRYVGNYSTGSTDPSGLDVYLVQHYVAAGQYHYGVIVVDPITGSGTGYDGGGPGPWGLVGSGKTFTKSTYPIPAGSTPPSGAIPVSTGTGLTQLEQSNLDNAYKLTAQIPEYDAITGPNSNTFARQLLLNAGFSPRRPPNSPGWIDPSYGGPGYDRWGTKLIRPDRPNFFFL